MIRVCIDFETTGLPRPMKDTGIVQIGAYKWWYDHAGELIEESFRSLINPEVDNWEQAAIKVHGITPEMVADSPTLFEVFHTFANMVNGSDVWVGYNPEFDVGVLQENLERYGFTTHFPWPPRRLDVMKLSHEYMNMEGRSGAKRPKLSEIYYELFDKELDGAHDAMLDVMATVEVLKELEKNVG